MEVAEAFSLISRAIDAGRAAHGYLIVGDVRGNCAALRDLILEKLFPGKAGAIAAGSFPDVVTLEPQGKSRTIKVERPKDAKDGEGPGMRDGMVEPMSVTAFAGGWKVGVIACADRMQPAAANAFLKSLEEPPPETLYLLLTDQPDLILPTIVSRTQRVDLKLPLGIFEGEEREAVAAAYAEKDSARLAEILKAAMDEVGDEDRALVRRRFYRTLGHFARELMIAAKLPRHQAFRNIELVEEAYRRSERSMSDESVLSYMLDRTVFGQGAA